MQEMYTERGRVPQVTGVSSKEMLASRRGKVRRKRLRFKEAIAFVLKVDILNLQDSVILYICIVRCWF